MTRFSALHCRSWLVGLGACGPITPAPDYAIKVAPGGGWPGYTAIPPNCPRWTDNDLNFFDNQPLPQFGCANARNFALMVDRPQDLLQGRDSGPASGVVDRRFDRTLQQQSDARIALCRPSRILRIDATTAPSAASRLTGETPAASSGSVRREVNGGA